MDKRKARCTSKAKTIDGFKLLKIGQPGSICCRQILTINKNEIMSKFFMEKFPHH